MSSSYRTYDPALIRRRPCALPMPASLTIRPATRADIPVLASFNAAMAWETERKRLDPARLARGIAGPFQTAVRGRHFVPEIDGAVAVTRSDFSFPTILTYRTPLAHISAMEDRN